MNAYAELRDRCKKQAAYASLSNGDANEIVDAILAEVVHTLEAKWKPDVYALALLRVSPLDPRGGLAFMISDGETNEFSRAFAREADAIRAAGRSLFAMRSLPMALPSFRRAKARARPGISVRPEPNRGPLGNVVRRRPPNGRTRCASLVRSAADANTGAAFRIARALSR
jgi:hypothetical protein